MLTVDVSDSTRRYLQIHTLGYILGYIYRYMVGYLQIQGLRDVKQGLKGFFFVIIKLNDQMMVYVGKLVQTFCFCCNVVKSNMY